MSEVITILGWFFNLRKLLIHLPKDKYNAWLSNLAKLTQSKKAMLKELEALLGQLNHLGYIIPLAHYFLNRLRHDVEEWKKRSCSGLSKHNEH